MDYGGYWIRKNKMTSNKYHGYSVILLVLALLFTIYVTYKKLIPLNLGIVFILFYLFIAYIIGKIVTKK